MYTDINNEIYELREKIREKDKLISQRDMLTNELERKRRLKDSLYNELIKEREMLRN